MLNKTIGDYRRRLFQRIIFLQEKQLGDDTFNQVMVHKEITVLESVMRDLKHCVENDDCYFSYWNC